MKFIHLADLHLGKRLNEFDLIDDQKFLLHQVIRIAEKHDAHTVLLSGDIYDKAIPSEAAVTLFDEFLKDLAEHHIESYIITGNHDSEERLNFGSSFFEASGVHIFAIYNGELAHYTVQDEYGPVELYLLPFVKASMVKNFYPEETIESYEDAVRVAIAHAEVNPSARNVILAHQFVTGQTPVVLGGSESVGVRQVAESVGTVEQISYKVFDDFDYVALGHIHSGQQVGRETVRYAGSLMKYSLSEVNSDKSVPVVTLGKAKGEVSIEYEPLHPLHNLRHIKGEMKTLLARENVVDAEDYMYVTLTDEEIINDAIGILQQTYPNTVKLDYENSHTKEIQTVDISKVTETRSFQELISDFYQEIYGVEMTEEELKVMLDVAGEAGVEL